MSRWQLKPGLQIALDGPSGSGKGTVASMLAEELGLPVLDTGLLYRLIGGLALQREIALDDDQALVALVEEMLEKVQWSVDGIAFAGENWTDRLRSEAVGAAASTSGCPAAGA